MDPAVSLVLVGCFVAVAAWSVAVWWERGPAPEPVMIVVPGPHDGEPHTLTLLGPNGQPIPSSYEHFADYPSALARQRALDRRGRASVVFHTETGEVRVDVSAWLGPYGRITL